MAYSETFPYTGSNTLYVKPVSPGSLPNNSAWGDDDIAQNSSGFSAVTFTGLADNQVYWVFEQLGGSPANTDILLGEIQPNNHSLNTIATEISKIPRAASPLTAGGNATRNKVLDTENALTETIS
jgi:hypothetical protein